MEPGGIARPEVLFTQRMLLYCNNCYDSTSTVQSIAELERSAHPAASDKQAQCSVSHSASSLLISSCLCDFFTDHRMHEPSRQILKVRPMWYYIRLLFGRYRRSAESVRFSTFGAETETETHVPLLTLLQVNVKVKVRYWL